MSQFNRRIFECPPVCWANHYRCGSCGQGICADSINAPSLRGLNSDQVVKKIAFAHAEAYGKEHEYHYVNRKQWR